MQSRNQLFRLVVALIGALASVAVSAQNNNFEEPPPWQEQAQTPPAHFELDGLIPIDNPSRSSRLSYGIAPATVAVGPDKVVRYVVVAQSPSGAMNVLYEGVRCDTREVKVYASWRKDSGWRELGDAQWTAVRHASSRYAQALANDGFCDVRIVWGSAEQIVKRLRDASKPY
ncbi:CNP1-like family protein [Comamonadaceae bacterium M7527]|nr:CNP1-like family protein [Comamonadaceae bacterium M7527]